MFIPSIVFQNRITHEEIFVKHFERDEITRKANMFYSVVP